MYVPIAMSNSGGTMTMTASEGGAFAAVAASTTAGAPAGTAAVAVVNGSATVIEEETTSGHSALETYPLSRCILAASADTVAGSAAPLPITATVSYAPIGATSNVPNFINGSSTVTVNGSTFWACGSTISFGTPGDQVLGSAPVTLTATGTSGVPVSFASTTPGVCTVAGNVATLTGTGACSITASQAGNSFYAAATPVTESFNVTAPMPVVSSIAPNSVAAFSRATPR